MRDEIAVAHNSSFFAMKSAWKRSCDGVFTFFLAHRNPWCRLEERKLFMFDAAPLVEHCNCNNGAGEDGNASFFYDTIKSTMQKAGQWSWFLEEDSEVGQPPT